MTRRPCIVLGASGLVGQRLQQRLIKHPLFELKAVSGSKLTAGKRLSEVEWRLEQKRPNLPDIEVLDSNSEHFISELKSLGIEIAFSALPDDIASIIEVKLANSGIIVFSNSNAHRRKPDVPLVIPEINLNHLLQSGKGIFCATNCTLLPVAIPLSAICQKLKISHVQMKSRQALSGAGWRLLFDQDALNGNHDTLIPGESEKTTAELLHIFNQADEKSISSSTFTTDFQCRRVTRKDGHLVLVEVTTEDSITIDEVHEMILSFNNSTLNLSPSSPIKPIHIVDKIDIQNHLWSDGVNFSNNPNPTEDLKTGMAIVVGDLKVVNNNTIHFSAYSHNTIRGAAGGVILLAELAAIKSLI
jgi:aspartate-semialdehyde dehydrogenase